METAFRTTGSTTPLSALIYNRQEKPFGRTWEEWTIKWWRWLLSIPKDKNPGLDMEGRVISMESADSDVIFLIGNYGGRTQRHYVIPAGKAALFPIINFQTSYTEEPHLKTEEDLKLRARKDMDDIVTKQAEIDGMPLVNVDDYRVQSDVFDIEYQERNVFDLAPGPTRGASDGYWIFLRPQSPSEHFIHTVGACSLGKTTVECFWRITVV
jgi:hypothetical protein